MKLLISFVLLFVFAVISNAQKTPTYKERAGKVLSMSNMIGNSNGFTCKPKRIFSGTVISRGYAVDDITISGFILKSANDTRTSINIDSDHLNVWGRETNRMISEILALNSKIKVSVSECSGGGSGVFIFAKQIVKY